MGQRHTTIPSALGEIVLVAEGDALTGLFFPDSPHLPAPALLGEAVLSGADPLLRRASAQLAEYLSGERTAFELPMSTAGDSFQERVWALLGEIPYGETITYGELAGHLGNRALAQRVGQAVGRNPLCVFVPCHRVLGAGGKLTGYAGGLTRKMRLLEIEGPLSAQAEKLF